MQAREPQASNRRLDSWKEIAAFFGRDERTVKRWEKERALPATTAMGPIPRASFSTRSVMAQTMTAASQHRLHL